MRRLFIHADTETTGLSATRNGIHSLGFVAEIYTSNERSNESRLHAIGYWEFNPEGRERTEKALEVSHTSEEELDSRPAASLFAADIKAALLDCIATSYVPVEEVYIYGSYPKFDVDMIAGMDFGWTLADIIHAENVLDNKDFFGSLQRRGVYPAKAKLGLQEIVDHLGLRARVDAGLTMMCQNAHARRYGNGDPLKLTKSHTAVYDCICSLLCLRAALELGAYGCADYPISLSEVSR